MSDNTDISVMINEIVDLLRDKNIKLNLSDQNSIYLFGRKNPDVFLKETIYDPDRDGKWYPNSPKMIPHPGSLALSQIGPSKFQVEMVHYVDEVTHKVTYADIGWVIDPTDDKDITRIVSYANDRYMLYYDDRTKPTKLWIDAKLPIMGNENILYRLVHTDDKGHKEVISLYIDSNDTIKGQNAPLVSVDGLVGVKLCTNCHTLSKCVDGDTVKLEIFNTLGAQTAEITLIVKRAGLINDLNMQNNPIVAFNATSAQMMGEDFYLYQRQDPHHLGILPYIVYHDGTRENLDIDNQSCFIYGMDDLVPSFPGRRQKILIKVFLNRRQVSPIAVEDEKHRYLAVEKNIIILPDTSTYGVKLSPVLVWNSAQFAYNFNLFLYSDRKDRSTDVTQFVSVKNFDGGLFYTEQKVTFEIDLKNVFGNLNSTIYRQIVYVRLYPHTDFMKYIFKESENAPVAYGVQSSNWNRPVIYYDNSIEKYFISTSIFPTKEDFLQVFYENSSPLVSEVDTLDPTLPTHFTIRNPYDGNVLISSPVPVEQYHQAWNVLTSLDTDVLVNDQVIVEFLQYNNGVYSILYGAPVDVYVSKSPYIGG